MRASSAYFGTVAVTLTVAAAGCGSGTVTKTVTNTTAAASSSQTTVATESSPSAISASNCQFVNGKWVTNVLTNPRACVPDPADATGDVKLDEGGVEPRCFKCTMAQWNRAETKARDANAPTVSSTTHTAPPRHHASPSYAATFPTSFESAFTVECLNTSGGNSSGCACVLRHIEAAVPYSKVTAAQHAIAVGDYPSWYTAAANACRS